VSHPGFSSRRRVPWPVRFGCWFCCWCCCAFSLASELQVGARSFTLEPVADGVLVHVGRHRDASVANAADIANLSVVIGERSIALIDPGGSRATAEALKAALREHSELPISHLVLTHAHPDHVFGAGGFAEVPEVFVHAGFERARLARRASDQDRFGPLGVGLPPVVPSVALQAGTVRMIELGARRLRVVALTPAHTDHDLMVIDERTGTLFAGDVVVGERLPSLDGDLLGWIRVLDDIAVMPLQRIVPGHGRPGPPAALLGPMSDYLQRLRDSVRASIARGDSMAAAVAAAERSGAAGPIRDGAQRWRLDRLHHPFNVTRAWSQLEWE